MPYFKLGSSSFIGSAMLSQEMEQESGKCALCGDEKGKSVDNVGGVCCSGEHCVRCVEVQKRK